MENTDGSVGNSTSGLVTDTSQVVLSFKTAGTPDRWDMCQSFVNEMQSAYGDSVDVVAEARKALAWTRTNHLKTARGMPRFLNCWLSKAANERPSPGRRGRQMVDTFSHEARKGKESFDAFKNLD